MLSNEIIGKIDENYFNDDFNLLYNETENAKIRYKDAVKSFEDLFGVKDAFLFSAPGRTEVGGNHTDHQHGSVLAGSVNLDIIAVAAKNDDNVVRIKSKGYDMDTVSLDNLEPDSCEYGKAAALIKGMLSSMKAAGYEISGFDAYTTSNVLKGSGLSSSAAFEVAVGVMINELFNGGKCSAVDIAKFAQKAENVFFGKPSGLMDQMSSSVGGFTAIDFKDPQNPVIKKIDFDFVNSGHSLCIVNTGGNHADLTQDYADITVGDREVAEFFGKEYLRDVDEKEFFANIAKLREKVSDKAILSSLHFFADTVRAEDEAKALANGNFNEFLRLINESGNSSFKYLQNVFSVRCPNEQGLSVAIALTEKFLGNRGAVRVHGGGFAGTIQAFVPNDMLESYKEMIEGVFGTGNCYVLNIRPVGGYALKK